MRRYIHVPSSPMTVSQGEFGDIKDRELKWSQEEKAWIGKEGIYKKKNKQKIDLFILQEKGLYTYGLETSDIRMRVCEAMDEETKIRESKNDVQAYNTLVFCSHSYLKD